jgi:hypothetical protein
MTSLPLQAHLYLLAVTISPKISLVINALMYIYNSSSSLECIANILNNISFFKSSLLVVSLVSSLKLNHFILEGDSEVVILTLQHPDFS